MGTLTAIKEYIGEKFLKGKKFEFFYNLGIDFYGKKDYENAVKYFKLAIEQQEVKPQVYYNLALTYQYMKDYDTAVSTYNKFLELVPDDYDGLYNLALTYQMKENLPKAIELFEKAIAIKKEEDVVKMLVSAYLAQNETQKAIDFAEELFTIPENGDKLYYVVAKLFEGKNSFSKEFTFIDKAIEMYTKIVEKDPQNFEAYLSISICYAKKGEWENSVNFCQKALDTNPKSYEANNQMGLVYYCFNDIKEAIKYYEIALKLNPNKEYKIYSNLGYAYEKVGQTGKAIKIFSQLVSKFPNCPAKDEIKNHLRILKSL